jgi:uncharacterized protein
MVSQTLIQKTAVYVKAKLMKEFSGSDWSHIERVWKMAKRLQKEEGGDLELVELAALLHDLGDYKNYEFNEIKGSLVLHGMMDVLDIDEKDQEKLLKIIDEAQYNGNETKVPPTIEGKILQDADWLEALGAIGIARVFATGGYFRRVIHDPKRKPRKNMSKKDYQLRKQEGTSINYFYEKSFKLVKMMNTKTGREIAKKREQFLKNYIEEFLAECEGEK